MARSKLRKTNSALSRGQMVRVENRFVFRLEEDIYDPDEIGSCCTENSEGTKCVCADNITARECCEQKGEFFRGLSCDTDPCPCNDTGACCISCPNDLSKLGICVSGVTAGFCTSVGGNFFLGVDCKTNNPCSDDCPDPEPIYRASISCCRPCPDGTNTARNGTCTTYTGSGFSTTEAIENANAQCVDGIIVNTTTGSVDSPPIDPCSIPSEDGLGGFGGCPNCNAKKRPCCQFCDDVTGTDCESTQSGICYEVEVDFGGEVIGPSCEGALTNPPGTTDLFCTDDGGANACSGSIDDCTTCQEVCCCEDGIATPTLPENCTGPVIDLEPGQACDNTLFCELPFYCIECDGTSTCDENNITNVTAPGSDQCVFEINPEFGCRVVNTNEACPGFERPEGSDVEGPVDCDVFGAGSNPAANGDCGCGNCNPAALQAYIANNNLCTTFGFCNSCDSCNLTLIYGGALANCGSSTCCRDVLPPNPDACGNIITP